MRPLKIPRSSLAVKAALHQAAERTLPVAGEDGIVGTALPSMQRRAMHRPPPQPPRREMKRQQRSQTHQSLSQIQRVAALTRMVEGRKAATACIEVQAMKELSEVSPSERKGCRSERTSKMSAE